MCWLPFVHKLSCTGVGKYVGQDWTINRQSSCVTPKNNFFPPKFFVFFGKKIAKKKFYDKKKIFFFWKFFLPPTKSIFDQIKIQIFLFRDPQKNYWKIFRNKFLRDPPPPEKLLENIQEKILEKKFQDPLPLHRKRHWNWHQIWNQKVPPQL